MRYNLLFDTLFEHGQQHWKFINCRYERGEFISSNKVFGIEQELTLPKATTLYLRCKYEVLTYGILKVIIGIEENKQMSINSNWVQKGKEKMISVVEVVKQEKVKVHIIFESIQDENRVKISEPMLCDLSRFMMTTYLKPHLDKSIVFRTGYDYENILGYNEFTSEMLGTEEAKIGTIFNSLEPLDVKIDVKLTKGIFYLVKLDYTPINDLGMIKFTYGINKSKDYNNEQIYMLFKATNNQDLILHLVPTSVLPYQVNIKHIMVIETTMRGIDIEDIPHLVFI